MIGAQKRPVLARKRGLSVKGARQTFLWQVREGLAVTLAAVEMIGSVG